MSIKRKIRKLLRKVGFDVTRVTPVNILPEPLKHLLFSNDINIFLDVGANSGEYAQQIRNKLGYKKKIVSFEPLSSAFNSLKIKSNNDSNWDVLNFALGDSEGKEYINIASNSYSSSLLEILPIHQRAAPESKYIGKEIIKIKKLDSIFKKLCKPTDKVYLKIDAQGFESKILNGAKNSLQNIELVQLELSFVPLYDGELLFNEMVSFMFKNGYKMVAIEPGFKDRNTGQLLQVDGFFKQSKS